MHIEEYSELEKKGIQLGCGEITSGKKVLFFASEKDDYVQKTETDDYVLFSTSLPEGMEALFIGALDAEKLSSSLPSSFSLVGVSKKDASSFALRKKENKTEIWHYSAFPGFGHVLDSENDEAPVVLDFSGDFSSSLNSIWSSNKEFSVFEIDLEGGKRAFKR